MMDTEKVKAKLKKLTNIELRVLLGLVQEEISDRPQYLDNKNNTPREQCNALSSFFNGAWIHG